MHPSRKTTFTLSHQSGLLHHASAHKEAKSQICQMFDFITSAQLQRIILHKVLDGAVCARCLQVVMNTAMFHVSNRFTF